MGIDKIDSDFVRQETPQFVLPFADVEMKPAFEHDSSVEIKPEEITSFGVIADKNA